MQDRNIISISDAWVGVADCRRCQIRESVLFSELDEDDFERIHKPITQYILPPGKHLYHMEEVGSYIYTIRKGMLKLTQYLPDGTQRIVRLVRGNDLVGFEALLGKPYHQEAIALQETELCKIPVSVIRDITEGSGKLQNTILDRCQRALQDADNWLTELSTGSAKQRVARLLLQMVQDDPEQKCYLCNREDMGAMLGLTIETTSRAVAEFKRRSYIRALDQRRVVCDVDKLKQVSDGLIP
jgi:CRP-like cAMP-binding protein